LSASSSLPQPLRAVTFDCWSTLLVEKEWPKAHRLRVEALRDAAREAGRPIDLVEASRCFDAAWERHMKLWREGIASGAGDVAQWALESLAIEGRGDVYRHLVSHFEEASHSGRVTVLDGARATLTGLRAGGVRCRLV